MRPRRRRRSDAEERRPFWRAIPHYYAYPLLGAIIGLGSPVGAFLLRYWLADPVLKVVWMRSELDYNFLFYAYMAVGTVSAFMVFGYVLGLRSERQKVSNRRLSVRVDELHVKSVTDALTGAFTYGYLYEVLEIEIQRSLTEKRPLSALIVDIDEFKLVNDSHGHLFGDRVIRETAETIAAHVRSHDVLGRYGGDEFVVVMPGADAPTALHVAERVRSGIAKNGYLTTASIGVATFDGASKERSGDLLHRADMNLYQAKHDGRNCVRDHCDEPDAPLRRRGELRP
ncbi:MAG TPA: GGDEF domain-containing protein [Elusimicrobiota bacterium]|jgi:diguanylate cyclase (GGDEF)-like protein|nr:GGDEF domain-containing protein [Elusimicrobiota bacterium]